MSENPNSEAEFNTLLNQITNFYNNIDIHNLPNTIDIRDDIIMPPDDIDIFNPSLTDEQNLDIQNLIENRSRQIKEAYNQQNGNMGGSKRRKSRRNKGKRRKTHRKKSRRSRGKRSRRLKRK